MKEVLITRYTGYSPGDKQSLGTLVYGKSELFVCKSLELPWKNNQNNISCIPTGTYTCIWTRSNRLSTLAGHDVFTYELSGVPGRLGIRIHSANYFFQLLGCIALGDSLKDINLDSQLDTIHSGNTVKKFNELMNKENFQLRING